MFFYFVYPHQTKDAFVNIIVMNGTRLVLLFVLHGSQSSVFGVEGTNLTQARGLLSGDGQRGL